MKNFIPFVVLIFFYSCQSAAVREPNYEKVIEEPVQEEDVQPDSLRPTIELYGTFFQSVRDSDTTYVDNGRITLIDEGFAHEVQYDSTGYYKITMLFGRQYSIRYSAPGFYTKFLDFDTRFIPDSVHGAGILMPTDMQIAKAENAEIEELLENNPIGKAFYREKSNDLGWDFEYTDSLRQVIEVLKDNQ